MSELTAVLRAAMKQAMRAHDQDALRALRTAVAAIDNAAAAPAVELDTATGGGPIAGAARGVGATEVARRELTDNDVAAIVRTQIDERRAQADEFDGLGQTDAATARRREADALDAVLGAR